ncbi:MAG TPA: hypothetical protein VMT19_10300 [Thermoanaerobaculaceae bacterium]|nr:hypothetical protein [Thermoanaerobaculaceae bacterium]
MRRELSTRANCMRRAGGARRPNGRRLVLAAGAALAAIAALPPADAHARRAAEPVRPLLGDRLPGAEMPNVVFGFRLAVSRVRNDASCDALFARLGTDGVRALARSVYLARSKAAPNRCAPDIAAFTWVGDRRVVLCPAFAALPLDGAAAILIHEALHSAGLGERPADPRGLRSADINREVVAACGL